MWRDERKGQDTSDRGGTSGSASSLGSKTGSTTTRGPHSEDSRSWLSAQQSETGRLPVISPAILTRGAFYENNLGERKSKQEDRLKRSHELELDGTESKKKRPNPIDLAALNSSRTAPSLGSGSTNGYSQRYQNSPFSYPMSSRSTFTDVSDVTSPITESAECHTEKCAEQVEPRIHLTHNQLSAALEFQFWELESIERTVEPDQPASLDFLDDEAINKHSVTCPVLMIDYISPTEQYTWPNILTIKKAADFFLSSSILEHSFNLNLLVWKQLQNPWYPQFLSTYADVDPLLEWNTLLSCARSATGPSHLTIVRLLIEQKIGAMKDTNQDDGELKNGLQKVSANLDAQRFLLNMLLAEICQRQGETKNANQYMQTASSSLPEVSRFRSVFINQEGIANMGFYYYLIRGYAHRIFMAGQTVDRTTTRQLSLTFDDPLIGMTGSLGRDLEELQQIFLAQKSGLFSLRDGQMQNRCIKNALHWCRMQLDGMTTSPSSEPLECNAQKSNWTMQYRIYKFLWERWSLEAKNESGVLAKWTGKIEKTGISVAELLDLICSALISDLPAAYKASLWIDSRHGVGPDLELFDKAAASASKLARTSDIELANRLCSLFLLRHRERHCDWEELDLKTKVQVDAIRLVEETLNLHIPKVPIPESSQQPAPSEVLNDNEHRSSNLSSSGRSGRYDPTLALSYCSSERSSMQRLSTRIMEARHSKRSSTSMAPSRATRLSYMNMFNRRPPSADELSDSMSSMNLSKERWSQFSTSSRTDAFSAVEDLIRHVGLERLGAVSEGDE